MSIAVSWDGPRDCRRHLCTTGAWSVEDVADLQDSTNTAPCMMGKLTAGLRSSSLETLKLVTRPFRYTLDASRA